MSIGNLAFGIGLQVNPEAGRMPTFFNELRNRNLLPVDPSDLQVKVVYPQETDFDQRALYGDALAEFYEAKERMIACVREATEAGLNLFHPKGEKGQLQTTSGGRKYAVLLDRQDELVDLRKELSGILQDHTGKSFGHSGFRSHLVVAGTQSGRGRASGQRTPSRSRGAVRVPTDIHITQVEMRNGVNVQFPIPRGDGHRLQRLPHFSGRST